MLMNNSFLLALILTFCHTVFGAGPNIKIDYTKYGDEIPPSCGKEEIDYKFCSRTIYTKDENGK